MSRSRKMSLSIVAVGLLLVIGKNFGNGSLGTSVVNVGNRDYYQDEDGALWESKKSYENYDDTSYFVAPDGSYWVNEYRYLQSKR